MGLLVFDSQQGQGFPFSVTCRLALEPTQPLIQWVVGTHCLRGKVARA